MSAAAAAVYQIKIRHKNPLAGSFSYRLYRQIFHGLSFTAANLCTIDLLSAKLSHSSFQG